MTLDDLNRLYARFAVSAKKRRKVYLKLAKMIDNGLQLQTAIDKLQRQASKNGRKPKEPLAMMLADWSKRLTEKGRLSDAVDGWVPKSEKMMLMAGEAGHGLSTVIRRMVEVNEGLKKMRATAAKAIMGPSIQILISAAVLYGFSTMVIPEFSKTVPVEDWTGQAAVMADVAGVISTQGPLIAIAVLGAVAGIAITMPMAWGMLTPVRKALDRVPPWSLYRQMEGAKFLLSVSSLVQAEVEVTEAISRIEKQGVSGWMKERVRAALPFMRAGKNMGLAFQQTKTGFPDDEVNDDLAIYAEQGDFADALENVANDWLKEGQENINAQAVVLEAVGKLAFFSIVVWIVTGMFAMMQLIQDSARAMT